MMPWLVAICAEIKLALTMNTKLQDLWAHSFLLFFAKVLFQRISIAREDHTLYGIELYHDSRCLA